MTSTSDLVTAIHAPLPSAGAAATSEAPAATGEGVTDTPSTGETTEATGGEGEGTATVASTEAAEGEKQPKLSKAFTAIARKEREVREREGALKAERARIAQEAEKLTALKAEVEKFETVRKSPKELLKYIAAQGVSWDDLAEELNRPADAAPSPAEVARDKELAALKAELAELRAAPTKREQEASAKAAVEQFIGMFDEGTKYPIAAALATSDELAALGDFAAGRMPKASFDDIAQAVDEAVREGFVLRQVDGQPTLVKDTRRAKLASQLAVSAPVSNDTTQSPPGQGRQVPKAATLTNARAAEPAAKPVEVKPSGSFRDALRASLPKGA